MSETATAKLKAAADCASVLIYEIGRVTNGIRRDADEFARQSPRHERNWLGARDLIRVKLGSAGLRDRVERQDVIFQSFGHLLTAEVETGRVEVLPGFCGVSKSMTLAFPIRPHGSRSRIEQ